MKKNTQFSTIFICAFILSLFSIKGFTQTIDKNCIDGKIYFKIKDDVNLFIPSIKNKVNISDVPFIDKIKSKYKITKLIKPFYTADDSKLQKTYSVKFDNYLMVDQLIKDLQNNNIIEYAEKAPLFKLLYTPNDEYYGNVGGLFLSANAKWHLDKINAEAAWDISNGSPNVKVAVLDNAIWTAHPDLQNKIVAEIDLADDDNDASPPSDTLVWSHGTHTSGLIGAETDNNIGVASIGYNISIIAVKVAEDVSGGMSAGFEGIVWAADNDADVISMSWGSSQYFVTMQNTINYAYNKGCVLVAASGNNGDGAEDPNNVNYIGYPAALDHVIAVGSTEESDVMSSFSEYGDWIDVCAPGGFATGGLSFFSILSTTYCDAGSILSGGGGAADYGVTGKYELMQGTSMSTPITAGLCGLMLSVDSNLTPDKLTMILKASCDNIESLQDADHVGMNGAGRINAGNALQMVLDSMKSIIPDFTANTLMINQGGSIDFTDQTIGNPVSWNWTFEGAYPNTSTDQNPTNIAYDIPGTYNVTLTVQNDSGVIATETKNSYIFVKAPSSSAWIEQATHFNTPYRGIYQISIVDPNIAWAYAYNGVATTQNEIYTLDFVKTLDGGEHWTPGTITGVPSTYHIGCINAASATKSWVTMWNDNGGGTVFATTDGGATWNMQPTAEFLAPNGFPNVIHFFNETDGFCMGDPNAGYFELYTTTNGGNTWTRVPQANVPDNLSGEMGWTGVYDTYGDTIWFGTNNGRIFKSNDKGMTWNVYTTGLNDIQKIAFNNGQEGITQEIIYDTQTGQITNFEMKKTSDGGENWATVSMTGDYFKSDIDAVPETPGMYVSIGSSYNQGMHGSSFSLDYGSTWTLLDTVQYTCVKFYDIQTGWAGGFNLDEFIDGIYKWKGIIQVSTMPYGPFCAGDSIDVAAKIMQAFNAGNIFTAQLSDANGNFSNPVNIGNISATTTDTIHTIIPISTLTGTGYRIRVTGSDPVLTSLDNGIDIKVNAIPTVYAGYNDSICYLNIYQLNANASDYDSLSWTTSGTGSFSDTTILNPTYTPSIADSGTVVNLILTAYSQCGISSDTMYLELITNATANAGPDVSTCLGDSVNLLANGGDIYIWAPATTLSNPNIQNPWASPTVTTTYTVTVTSGCGTAFDDVVVIVNPLPDATITQAGPTTFCQGNEVILNANTGTNLTYQWKKDGTDIIGAVDSSYIAQESGNYTIVVTNNFICSNTSSSVTVTANPLPDATITPSGPISLCEGDSIFLSVYNDTACIYQWFKDGDTIPGATNNYYTTYEDGNYSVNIINTNTSCNGNSLNVNVAVHPIPAKPTIVIDNDILYSSEVHGNQWFFDGDTIQGATERPYEPTQTGSYTVQVTSEYGCSSEMSDPYEYDVSINEITDNINNINIFPNPTNGSITVEFNVNKKQSVNIRIYDIIGDFIYEKNQDYITGHYTTIIDLSNISKGMYYLVIQTDTEIYKDKIIIE